MSSATMCRVCLVKNLNLYDVRNDLQDMYELITSEKYYKLGYPVFMCYICLSVLRKCHRFVETARDTNNVLKQWYKQRNEIKIAKPLSTYSVSKVEILCLGNESGILNDDIEMETVDVKKELEEDIEFTVHIDVDTEQTEIDDETDVHDLLVESDNDSTDNNTIEVNDDRQTDTGQCTVIGRSGIVTENVNVSNKIQDQSEPEEEEKTDNNQEVSGKSDFEDTSNLTLGSDLSIFIKKSQIMDPLSDSNFTVDELRDFNLNDMINHYNTGHENLQHTPSLSNLTSKAEGTSITKKETNAVEIDKNINNTLQKQKENKIIRKPDFCLYCKKQILNFSRHLLRHHATEREVQKIFTLPKKSAERKKQLTSIRKKGNYVLNTAKCVKPMKTKSKSLNDDYLPCPKCLGFYARKQLWKHRKRCAEKDEKITQADAQNFLVRHLKLDTKLKDLVFSRMRADELSLIVKQDAIICAFGARYLKTRRETYSVNVVSRKMRELAKLLIEIRKLKPEVLDLFSTLKPEYYHTIVKATKNCAKFDDKKGCFRSPTFAMNISTSIKQCCKLAIIENITQKGVKDAEIEADLKTLIQLIETNWKFDVSSQAADDLYLNKWNKITKMPLASGLKTANNTVEDSVEASKQAQATESRTENNQNEKSTDQENFTKIAVKDAVEASKQVQTTENRTENNQNEKSSDQENLTKIAVKDAVEASKRIQGTDPQDIRTENNQNKESFEQEHLTKNAVEDTVEPSKRVHPAGPHENRTENNQNEHKAKSTFSRSIQKPSKKKRNLVPWTAEQKCIVLEHFRSHVRQCKPPKRAECDVLKSKHPDILANKDWLKIKVFIQNTYTKK